MKTLTIFRQIAKKNIPELPRTNPEQTAGADEVGRRFGDLKEILGLQCEFSRPTTNRQSAAQPRLSTLSQFCKSVVYSPLIILCKSVAWHSHKHFCKFDAYSPFRCTGF